ncbi:MAG: iron-sulfur cluster assembly accessory protein [Acidobacteriota bacterium]
MDKIRDAFKKQGVSGGLRLGVLGGGCSGLSYQFKFDPKPRATDKVITFDDVQVFIDPKSLVFLDGMTLDWKDSLMQSGFVFENPNAKKSCRLRHILFGLMKYYEALGIAPALALDWKT